MMKTPGLYFRMLCFKGLEERYKTPTKEITERLEYELSIIEKMGYVPEHYKQLEEPKFTKVEETATQPKSQAKE